MERQDILDTIGTLTNVEYMLRAFALVGNQETKNLHKAVLDEAARLRKLYSDSPPGEKERFRESHPPLYDQLDGLYDCGNPTCPARGFHDAADKVRHYRLWEIKERK